MEYISKNNVAKKTELIMDSVKSLSENLPISSFYQIAFRLRLSLNNLENDIQDYLNKQRIEKLRAGIKARAKIDECEDYLKLAKNMRYANTDDILRELEELKSWLFLEAEISKSKNRINNYPEVQ